MNAEIDVDLSNSNPLPFYYNHNHNHNSQCQNKNTLLYQSAHSHPYSNSACHQYQQHQQHQHPTAAPTPADIIMQDDQDEPLADPNNYTNMNGFSGNLFGNGNGHGNGLLHPVQVQQQLQLQSQQAGQYPFSFNAYNNNNNTATTNANTNTNTGSGVIPNTNDSYYNMNAFNNSNGYNGYNGVASQTIQPTISMQPQGQPQNQPMPFRHSYANSESSNSIGWFSNTGNRPGTGTGTGTGTSTPIPSQKVSIGMTFGMSAMGINTNTNTNSSTGTNMNMNAPQPGYKRSYSQTINPLGLSDDLDPNFDASSFNSIMSDDNAGFIKRLCIRDDEEQVQEQHLASQQLADGSETEGYASELASSTGPSECATADSASYIALPTTGPAVNRHELKKSNLKRPHSFLSIDATAGSANTFLSSVGSDEVDLVAVAIALEGHMRGPPFKRMSTVRIDELERGLPGQCDAMQLSQENGDGHGEGQAEHVHLPHHGDEHSDYKNFNNVLGSLHEERERRNKEMSNLSRRRSLQTTSGSVSSLTSFSTTTGTGTGAAGGQNRWRIPKQVHLQSSSNLG